MSLAESLVRQQLRELEATGLYVFHGTATNVDELETWQAIDDTTSPDDNPGIHASQVVDCAIFMAVAAPLGRTRSEATSIGDSLIMDFGIEKTAENRLTDQTGGWVYVCDKKDFKQRRPAEWISAKPVRPVSKLWVSKRDLPKNVQVL